MLNIGLVDDHLLFRQSLKNFIGHQTIEDMHVVLEACNGEELKKLLQLSEKTVQDLHILLIDVKMPVMNGMEATSFIRQSYPSIKIIGLSAFFNEYLIRDLLRRGAQGYISKSADIDVLMKAIKAVMGNAIFVENHPEIFHDMPAVKLTEKQILFLRYCISERSYKHIADEMHLSYKTIDNYRDELFRMLDIKSRTGLALYAIRSGLEAID